MRAVITVIGKDMVGIISRVSGVCAKCDVNILDISQSILQDLFAMIMLVDIKDANIPFTDFVDQMNGLGNELGLTIHTMHEDIFQSMHKI